MSQCASVFLVAAYFIRLGKLKIGSRELTITELTGNEHEFALSVTNKEPARDDIHAVSEQVHDVSEHVHAVSDLQGSVVLPLISHC